RLVARLASQRGYSFISATASHLLSPYVGESEKKVASLFHSARLAQPSIIFIDEIGKGSSKGVRVNIITELLQAMDGGSVGAMSQQGSSTMNNYHKNIQDDFLVCSATNHPEKLDSALIRPGRFDHLIYVPPPNEEERFEILKLKSSLIKISEKLLKEIAARSERWSGSELENLINKALMKLIFSNRIAADAEEIHMPEELLLEEF
ncbi:Protein SAV, partial [Armadillidium nasatum]